MALYYNGKSMEELTYIFTFFFQNLWTKIDLGPKFWDQMECFHLFFFWVDSYYTPLDHLLDKVPFLTTKTKCDSCEY